MKNYVQKGETLTFTAAADVVSGQGVLLGAAGLFGVAATDVLSGASGEAVIEGVFSLPKTSADTPAAFAAAYWDESEGEVTTVATDNTLIGCFAQAYAASTALADVKLIPAIV